MKILLHICCGVCAAGVIERLIQEGHQVRGFFFNPNIYPEEEYQRRLEATKRVAEELGFALEVGPYLPQQWFEETRSLEDEPEGGRRCAVCYRLRLEKTYFCMPEYGDEVFTTTLTVSPHKSADVINEIGKEIGGDRFLARDFKKKAGFQRATQLAREWEIHRQDYCGCLYSLREKTGQ
ncbi:MAG: epoxyqueuosine reductase QueH [Dehalococcoidales bacterium]|nr:MAG: epoxyqueuosine reductase QueH [Dehalococcoidales bacterium]